MIQNIMIHSLGMFHMASAASWFIDGVNINKNFLFKQFRFYNNFYLNNSPIRKQILQLIFNLEIIFKKQKINNLLTVSASLSTLGLEQNQVLAVEAVSLHEFTVFTFVFTSFDFFRSIEWNREHCSQNEGCGQNQKKEFHSEKDENYPVMFSTRIFTNRIIRRQ